MKRKDAEIYDIMCPRSEKAKKVMLPIHIDKNPKTTAIDPNSMQNSKKPVFLAILSSTSNEKR